MTAQNTEQGQQAKQVKELLVTQQPNPINEVALTEDTKVVNNGESSNTEEVTPKEESSFGAGSFLMLLIGGLLYIVILLVAICWYAAMFMPRELSVYFYQKGLGVNYV